MIGVNDFIEYWSAAQLFHENRDFYDPALMAPVQQAQGFPATPPLMMWLPPWALLWVLPLLQFEFLLSAKLWAAMSILGLLAASQMWISLFEIPKSHRGYLVIASLVFVPTVSTLLLGQVSLLLFFFFTLAVWLLSKKLDFLAGCVFLSLTWKPHIFLILGPILAWWILRQHRFRVPLGFLTALLVSSALCWWLAPDSLSYWLQSIQESKPGAPAKLAWVTPTIVGMLRLVFADSPNVPLLPMILVPGVGLIVLFHFFALHRQRFELRQDLSFCLCVSFCLAPFAWIFDAVFLLPCTLLLLSSVISRWQRYRLVVIAGFSLAQVTIVFLHGSYFTSHHSFFWFPLLILLLETLRYRKVVGFAQVAS